MNLLIKKQPNISDILLTERKGKFSTALQSKETKDRAIIQIVSINKIILHCCWDELVFQSYVSKNFRLVQHFKVSVFRTGWNVARKEETV